MRKRSPHSRTERAGINAVADACNALNLIWRDLLQEDVGVDGTIEVALGEFPSGKLVGAQVKSGRSYMRAETETSFRFYPHCDDLEYWGQLSIPLFLFVHDPNNRVVYWADVSRHIQERSHDPLGPAYIAFAKAQILDSAFADYLMGLFDLASYDDAQFAEVRAELEAIIHTDGTGDSAVTVTALDLFVGGLWGLCSKLQFHSSLLADIFRQTVRERGVDLVVRYTFSRATLYPFFIRYFDVLLKRHLALLDAADINQSLYAKLEFPTFIASLTTNGRRFVEYLRAKGVEDARDNRYFTLTLIPHTQIEVYASFEELEGGSRFGPYSDVFGISFNPHLDYYHLVHWRRDAPAVKPERLTSQTIHYFELIDTIERALGALDKDRIVLRHLDIPISPLICWLEDWYGLEQPVPAASLLRKSNSETFGFHDEVASIMSAAGVLQVTEPALPPLPIPFLANGEVMDIP